MKTLPPTDDYVRLAKSIGTLVKVGAGVAVGTIGATLAHDVSEPLIHYIFEGRNHFDHTRFILEHPELYKHSVESLGNLITAGVGLKSYDFGKKLVSGSGRIFVESIDAIFSPPLLAFHAIAEDIKMSLKNNSTKSKSR